jgi:hypothetical protein
MMALADDEDKLNTGTNTRHDMPGVTEQNGAPKTIGGVPDAKTASPFVLIIALIISVFLILVVIGIQIVAPAAIAESDITRIFSSAIVSIVAAVMFFGLIAGSTANFQFRTAPSAPFLSITGQTSCGREKCF